MSTILIVDDHPVIRIAVKAVLEKQGHKVIAESDNGVDCIQQSRELSPELIILDIGIPMLDGLEVISRVKTFNSNIKIIVFTSQQATLFAPRCLKAGASGFVTKGGAMEELVRGVRTVLDGYSFFPSSTMNSAYPERTTNSDQALIKSLSDRELVVLTHLAAGLSNKEISEILLLSNKTISTYKTRIMEKLNLSNLLEICDFARRNKIS
ncbi:MAG: response regulator transcription factor [Kaiparowitsia implicata GSE-PSE-MK54-09C]|jgi:two-component system response regulator EvgA|nr:response regulator transcription factor [Kaiparowitsia implicata GSE-PSE-MK54-09C]